MPSRQPSGPLSANYNTAPGNAATLQQQQAAANAKHRAYSISVIPTKKLQAAVAPPTASSSATVESIDLTDEDDANNAAAAAASRSAIARSHSHGLIQVGGKSGGGTYTVNQTSSGVRYATQIPSAGGAGGAMAGPTRVRVGGNNAGELHSIFVRLFNHILTITISLML